MEYRAVPRTGLRLSAVGFGTCQLRLVPEQQAIDTLKRGFELGVNVVHTAPDYEGAEDLVAQAIAESGREVVVLTQGYGDAAHFAWLFGEACRRQRSTRLPMYGIACIDDRELLGENVWGPGGQVEFLLERKREGRLGGVFCTTHGAPEYVARLIVSGAFDAIMLAYNPLGFHLLSYNPSGERPVEDLARNRAEIFDLAARHRVALLVMKPLAGGLLADGRAFPARGPFMDVARPKAGEVLRSILAEHPAVTCVVPGTSSPDEAEENARAGFEQRRTDGGRAHVERMAGALATDLCSRCGACDTLCSQHLRVSWMFRDAYINAFPSETFETVDSLQYFHLHPREVASCRTCRDVTCACPAGIDIPASLGAVHDFMLEERARGRLPLTPDALASENPRGTLGARLVRAEVGDAGGGRLVGRFWLENGGPDAWPGAPFRTAVERVHLRVLEGERDLGGAPLRHDVPPGTRTHVAVELASSTGEALRLRLGTGEEGAAEWRLDVRAEGIAIG
jgi:predicted aldo/keto reductase-like oxidoreductase